MIEIKKDLLIAIKNKDKNSFKKFYDRTVDNIFSVSYNILLNHEDTQEAVQNTYIKVFNNIKTFDLNKSFKSWFYKIAINSAIDIYRKRKGYLFGLKNFFMERNSPILKKESESEKAFDNKEIIELKLKKLRLKDKKIILLSSVEGMNYEEISKILNININTIKTKIRRIKEKLGGVYE
jgi:RNA polymerase sigma-70 factor (ECF subfamily)